MNKLTIQNRIILTMSLVVILTISISAYALRSVFVLNKSVADVAENTVPSLKVLYDIKSDAQAEIGSLALSATGISPEARQKLLTENASASADIEVNLKKYDALVSDEEDRRLFSEIERLNKALVASVSKSQATIASDQSGDYLRAITQEIVPISESLVAATEADIAHNIKLSTKSSAEAKASADSANFYLPFGVALTILVVIGMAVWLIRSTNGALGMISTNLGEGARQTASAAGQVASSSHALSQGAADQASAVEETSASLEEISTMIRSTADNARKAKDLAGEARAVADEGTQTMSDMNEAMSAIDASSAEVAKIVKNIDEIAFQTNILALNAAVEAARAGQAGAGFAVVADEVRSLAQRSAAAAKETAEKIDAAISNSRRGSACTAMVGESLNKISARIAATDQLVGDIAAAASEQALGISQISIAINQMDSISQANSATAQQSAAAAEQLDAQAGVMHELVRRLDALLGRNSDEASERYGHSAQRSGKVASRAVIRAPQMAILRKPHAARPAAASDAIPMPADEMTDGFRSFSA
ncbi:MAG: methyl-accepting chemotaxis protein [Novosphingobium sp.]|uniref:methyl-accepting chemotaxis protein n=1 Tax=Novosphingobium sp. TaxID=1874826 RepID=UPI0030182251